MSIQDPGNRPGLWGVTGDHENRIRDLEAKPASGGGIQFDTDPQSGNWLVIDTIGSPGGGNARGIDMQATNGDFRIEATGAGFDMDIISGNDVNVIAALDFQVNSTDIILQAEDTAELQAGSTGNTSRVLLTGGDDALMESRAAQVGLEAGTFVYAMVGNAFIVFDASFNEIFRVDAAGDLHGKTGKALTFDL